MPCAFYPERLSLSNSKHKAMDFIWGNILMGTLFTILGLAIVKSANDPNHKFMLNMPFELKRKEEKIEAEKYAGKVSIIAGLLSILLGIILNLLITTENFTENKLMGINFITFFLTMMLTAIALTIMTEKHLKDVFGKKD